MAECLAVTLGSVIGQWTVVAKAPSKGHGTRWICRCSCGSERSMRATQLRLGNSMRCVQCAGALRRGPRWGQPRKRIRKRDLTRTSWVCMMRRCTKPLDKDYPGYGGSGIHVCDRWRTFDAFRNDMGERPSRAHTIDRIDNNRGYEPGNCRWATQDVQQRNRSNNIWVTFNGETQIASEWSRRTGITESALRSRLRNGWDPVAALITPVRPKRPNATKQKRPATP